jgi:hypothetical protein
VICVFTICCNSSEAGVSVDGRHLLQLAIKVA